MVHPLGKIVLTVSLKVKPAFTIRSGHSTHRCLPKINESIHAKVYAQMFIATFFVIAKNSEEPPESSISEWISKLSCIHIMKH